MMRRAQRWFAPVWVALVLALVPLGAAADEIEIRVTIETSPLWGFVGIGLIVAVLAGLWWVFRTYGRR